MGSLNKSINLTNYSLKKGIIITWIITAIINISVIVANIVIGNPSIGVVTGTGQRELLSIFAMNLLPFIIYFITNSMIIFSESLPISISYGLTRKNYFIAMVLNSLIISVIFAGIQGILFKAEPIIIDIIDKSARENFIFFNSAQDNIFIVIAILFLMIFSFISFINLIVGLNYKFGFKIWLVFAAIFLLLVLANRGLNISLGIMEKVDEIIYGDGKKTGVLIFSIIAIVSNIVNYFVIRLTDIRYVLQKSSN